jgi:hypothetical protein
LFGAVAKLASITFLSLAFSYWIDNLGFITEGKLDAVLIKPSLGVSNWPIIYIINYTSTVLWHQSTPRHQKAAIFFAINGASKVRKSLIIHIY